MVCEAPVLDECYRIEPKLHDLAIPLDMNVRRLVAIRAEEDE
jgi:hypothetical protein